MAIVRNISYVGIAQIVTMILTLVTAILLTRILTPEDFGIFSLGMVFIALFLTIQDSGIITAVVQRDSHIEEAISAGLTLRWIIAIVLFLGTIAISPFVAYFVGDYQISTVMIVFTINLFVLIYAFPAQTLLTRSLSFFQLSVATVVQYAVISVVSVTLALFGLSYWGLVYGSISGSIALVVVLRYYERRVFKPKLDTKMMSELLRFGKHILTSSLMGFIIFNVDQIMIASLLGIATLGVYFLAVRFGRTMGEQIAATVNRVLFPTMARLKDNPELLKTCYIQSLRMIAIVAVPLSVCTSVLSPTIVPVLLGDGWAAVTVPLSILSFQGLLNALIPPAASALVAAGKPRYVSFQASVQALALIAGIYPVALYFGLDGVCIFTTMLSFGVLIYFLISYSHIQKVNLKEIVRPVLPSAISGFVVFIVLMTLLRALPTGLFTLLLLVALGFAVYVCILYVTSKGADVRDFAHLLRNAVRSAK